MRNFQGDSLKKTVDRFRFGRQHECTLLPVRKIVAQLLIFASQNCEYNQNTAFLIKSSLATMEQNEK
jgi:hypothetical protein